MKQITEFKLPIVFALPFLMVALIGTVMPPAFADHDGDTIDDAIDNCPELANEDQADADLDLVGDACDNAPNDANPLQEDVDSDGIGDVADNCPNDDNAGQEDTDMDGIGDACDLINNVSIDVKPGSDTNPVNCKSKGVTPIAILMDEASLLAIDVDSLTLNGVAVTEKHGKVHLEDEDGDGVTDFGVVHILTQEVCNAPNVANGSVEVTLSDGSFEGTDTILVKKK